LHGKNCVFAGFLAKGGVERGFFVVNLWWIRGELWSVDGHFFGCEDFPRIADLFLRIPVLGIRGGAKEKADLSG
jgi:hypothetical protein